MRRLERLYEISWLPQGPIVSKYHLSVNNPAHWLSEWNEAERISVSIGKICATIPLRGSWEPNDRIALALASFRLTQEHHSSVHLLFENRKDASARALLRPLLEAGLRTIWIGEDADEQQIQNLLKDKGNPPLLGELNGVFKKGPEGGLSGQLQRLLHTFTHGGPRALAAQFLEGDKLSKSNAVIVALAGLGLAAAGYSVSSLLGRTDIVEKLTIEIPRVE